MATVEHILSPLYTTMSLAKLRLRHPKGIATLELDLDGSSVQELQQQIKNTTEILPSQQEC